MTIAYLELLDCHITHHAGLALGLMLKCYYHPFSSTRLLAYDDIQGVPYHLVTI